MHYYKYSEIKVFQTLDFSDLLIIQSTISLSLWKKLGELHLHCFEPPDFQQFLLL